MIQTIFRKITILATLCAAGLAGSRALAQPNNDINILNVAFRLQLQSPGYNSQNGTVREFANPVVQSINTKNLLDRLSLDKGMKFPGSAKLAVSGTNVIVVAGNNNLIVDVSDIISFTAGNNDILSGTTNNVTGLAAASTSELILVGFRFDDTSVTNGTDLSFSVTGLDTVRTKDSTPSATTGKYNETTSDRLNTAQGEGHSGGVPFVISGTIQGNRNVNLVYTPPVP
jgi:hypothetical protein